MKPKMQQQIDEMKTELANYKENVMDKMDKVPKAVSDTYTDMKTKLNSLEDKVKKNTDETQKNWKGVTRDISGELNKLNNGINDLIGVKK